MAVTVVEVESGFQEQLLPLMAPQLPDHPKKIEPGSGVALRLSGAPAGKPAAQVAAQSILEAN
ncbi:MAG: hypothetical protein IPK16_01565 [Anaerolineales bacterium]|nr:hypothetical protein [Anaerolineales bacterium]